MSCLGFSTESRQVKPEVARRLGVALAVKPASYWSINISGKLPHRGAAGVSRAAFGLLAAAIAFASASAAAGSGIADRVVLVANSDAPDSVSIARHYAEV